LAVPGLQNLALFVKNVKNAGIGLGDLGDIHEMPGLVDIDMLKKDVGMDHDTTSQTVTDQG
jgi:hypothetical protein